jgi:hypothetical protein
MLRRTDQLEQLEADFTRKHFGRMSYQEALAIFAALWAEARALNPDFPGDWRSDIGPDLAVARAVNGLSPEP